MKTLITATILIGIYLAPAAALARALSHDVVPCTTDISCAELNPEVKE